MLYIQFSLKHCGLLDGIVCQIRVNGFCLDIQVFLQMTLLTMTLLAMTLFTMKLTSVITLLMCYCLVMLSRKTCFLILLYQRSFQLCYFRSHSNILLQAIIGLFHLTSNSLSFNKSNCVLHRHDFYYSQLFVFIKIVIY